MSYVVAVDVGIKNLSLCVYDFVTSQVVFWDNLTLVPCGRYTPAHNVQYVRDFIQHHGHLFNNAHRVIIERQMRCNMRIIESVLQALFFERTIVISPRSVKAHYGLSMKNYRLNKARAIEWVESFVKSNPQVFAEGKVEAFMKAPKRDDLADSLLMVMYYLDTYSNQL